jgi:hypothetical protein
MLRKYIQKLILESEKSQKEKDKAFANVLKIHRHLKDPNVAAYHQFENLLTTLKDDPDYLVNLKPIFTGDSNAQKGFTEGARSKIIGVLNNYCAELGNTILENDEKTGNFSITHNTYFPGDSKSAQPYLIYKIDIQNTAIYSQGEKHKRDAHRRVIAGLSFVIPTIKTYYIHPATGERQDRRDKTYESGLREEYENYIISELARNNINAPINEIGNHFKDRYYGKGFTKKIVLNAIDREHPDYRLGYQYEDKQNFNLNNYYKIINILIDGIIKSIETIIGKSKK